MVTLGRCREVTPNKTLDANAMLDEMDETPEPV
jgi:hypothetical protein